MKIVTIVAVTLPQLVVFAYWSVELGRFVIKKTIGIRTLALKILSTYSYAFWIVQILALRTFLTES